MTLPLNRRGGHGCHASFIVAVVLVSGWQSRTANAQEQIEVEGVSFASPANLVAQPVPAGSGPGARLWRDSADTMSLSVVAVASDGAAHANELEKWPSVGKSFIDGFGNSNAKALSKATGAECSFSGTPLLRDTSRAMMGGEVTTTCQTSPATVLKSRLIMVATRSKQVIFRLDALPAADTSASKLVTTLWKSIVVSESARVTSSEASSVDVVDRTWADSVSGGHGVHIENYSIIRPEALVGQALGTLSAALLFGWLFTMLLMLPGLRPPYAVTLSQLICIGLAIWGNEHDGNWTLSPVMWVMNGIAAALLLTPAKRRWAKKHPAPVPNQGASMQPGAGPP